MRRLYAITRLSSVLPILAAIFIMESGKANAATIQPMSVSDIGVMQLNEDGTYSVVCLNGNRETVTDLDIRLNNVCPNRTESEPTAILSLQKREDGNFDVVCRDFTKKVATAEEILAGGVCVPPEPKIELENGDYTVTSGYMSYCPQTIDAHHENGNLTSLRVYFTNPCAADREMTCSAGVCMAHDYKIEVLSRDSYRFSEANGGNPGVFKKN